MSSIYNEPVEKTCRFCGARYLAETVLREGPQKRFPSHVALARFARLGCAAFGRYGLDPDSHQPDDGEPDE